MTRDRRFCLRLRQSARWGGPSVLKTLSCSQARPRLSEIAGSFVALLDHAPKASAKGIELSRVERTPVQGFIAHQAQAASTQALYLGDGPVECGTGLEVEQDRHRTGVAAGDDVQRTGSVAKVSVQVGALSETVGLMGHERTGTVVIKPGRYFAGRFSRPQKEASRCYQRNDGYS